MWTRTLASRVLRLLAEQRRRVVSDWRLLIVCRRVAIQDASSLPGKDQVVQLVRHLQLTEDLQSIIGVQGVYTVHAAYANVLPIADEELVQESNPWAVFSHHTALFRHGLTDEVPVRVFATHHASRGNRLPLGTTAEEWVGLPLPRARKPKSLNQTVVEWTTVTRGGEFGIGIDFTQGLPIYITDIERTLLDALRAPAKTGGIGIVLKAWSLARDRLNVDRLIEYTQLLDSPVMRQRVGFVLQSLGIVHPIFEDWKRRLQRGGSIVLHAGRPFEPRFSPDWNLSLNVAPALLSELEKD